MPKNPYLFKWKIIIFGALEILALTAVSCLVSQNEQWIWLFQVSVSCWKKHWRQSYGGETHVVTTMDQLQPGLFTAELCNSCGNVILGACLKANMSGRSQRHRLLPGQVSTSTWQRRGFFLTQLLKWIQVPISLPISGSAFSPFWFISE